MLGKVKLQFMLYDILKLDLMFPCRFDSIEKLYRNFCHDMDQNGILRTPQNIFLVF